MNAKSNKIRNSFHNFLSSLLKAASISLIGFIVTPFIIRWVGDESYSIYKLIFDWVSNVWMFDLGVSGGFLSISAIYIKKSKLNELYADGLRAHIRTFPYLFSAIFGIYFLLRFIIQFENVSITEFTFAYLIFASSFLFYPLNIFRQYFEVTERISFINKVTIIQLVLTNILMAFFAYIGFGLLGIAVAYSSLIILAYILMGFTALKDMNISIKDLIGVRGEYFSKIKFSGKDYLLINISQKISFLADNSIIAYFYSPIQVVPFFITQKLSALFQSQLQSISYSAWASLIDFYNQGQLETFREKFIEVFKFNLIMVLAAFCIVYQLNEPFIALWIGEKYFVSSEFNLVISILMALNLLNYVIGHTLVGTGHIKQQSRPYFYLGVLNLIVSIILAKYMGLIGPVLASTIMMSALLVYKFYLLFHVYDIQFKQLFKIVFKQSLILFVFIFSFSQILTNQQMTWPKLFLQASCIGFLYFIASWIFSMTKNEKIIWIRRIKNVLSR